MSTLVLKPILVVGCGNVRAGGDGFGPLVVQRLAGLVPATVELLDLSLNPTTLLDHLPGRRELLIVDAAFSPPHPPGQLLDLDFFSSDRPQLLSDRATSTHALSIAHQFELAHVLGLGLPARVRLIALTILPPMQGCQSQQLSSEQIDDGVRLVLRWTRQDT